MRLTRITPPEQLALRHEAVWEHLRLIRQGYSPDDASHVDRLIEGAVSDLDGAAGMLARALITQVWRLSLDRFPRVIELPLPPLQAVTAIEYMDNAGVLRTMDPADYVVAGIGSSWKGEVCSAYSKAWPATFCHHSEAVRVTFRCGFGDTPDDVPASIRAALLEVVASRYSFRESVTPAAQYFALPRSAQDALGPFVVTSL